MAELSGFSAATPLTPTHGPQTLRVPPSKEQAIAEASQILEGLWDAVEVGLSNNVRIEILKYPNGVTGCIIAPLQHNAIDRPVANPGDHIVVDGIRLVPMTDADFNARFTVAQQEAPPSTQPVAKVKARR